MASSILQVRIDENLKNQTAEIFNNLGLDMSSAIRLFLNRVIIAQGLPFQMNLENDELSFDPIEYLDQLKIHQADSKESDFDCIDFLDKIN